MSHHDHKSHHAQPGHEGHTTSGGGMKRHHKIIAIVALIAMLGALAIYVLTNDESVVPGQPERQPVPAAAP